MANYGVPYMGSKNFIAEGIIANLPPARRFYDLFAGGCAITHCAMESGKYQEFYCNDIDFRGVTLFRDAIAGKYKDERRVITREDFNRLKDTDPYVALCWSFGNNQSDYLWNDETAGAKILACKMVLSDSYDDRRAYFRQFIQYLRDRKAELKRRLETRDDRLKEIGDLSEYLRLELCRHLKESGCSQSDVNRVTETQMAGHYFGKSQWAFPTREMYNKMRTIMHTLPEYDFWGQDLQVLSSLESLESLERLENLENLENLQSLERLERLQRLQSLNKTPQITIGNYYDVNILPDSIVYCDPPYKGTRTYDMNNRTGGFDHDRFYDWLRNTPFPVYVSEYSMPDDFVSIWQTEKRVTLSENKSTYKSATEHLFIHHRWLDQHPQQPQQLTFF